MALIVQPQAHALRPVADAPRLTAASCELLRKIRVVDEHGNQRQIHLPAERALGVFVDDRELMTLTTLGASPELLVLGHLLNQRLIGDVRAIESITVDWKSGAAAVKTRTGSLDIDTVGRFVSTSCGLRTRLSDLMTQVGTSTLPGAATARISQRTLLRVLDSVRSLDAIHRVAGSVHSCALFRGADLFVSVEDVSRHNAIDTIAGWMALHGVAGDDKILFTTGRLTGEMVMRTAHNGIPIVVSRNGVTAMGYEIATKLRMTLFTRAANRRFLCCVGVERFDADPAAD
jgi:FdhD protein